MVGSLDKLFERILDQDTEGGTVPLTSLDTEAVVKHLIGDVLLNEQQVDGLDDLVLIDRRTETLVSHRDVGIGVSQILPVLVASFAYKSRLIAIEQPEIHLHPALQAELGDVFINSALGQERNTFLLETHSEHLLLRLLRRIRETAAGESEPGDIPISPDDVAVLYVLPTSSGSLIRHLPITEDGQFEAPWPNGFFAERAREMF
jgi:predicted ATPase